MDFIYNNKNTGTFVEFSMSSISDELEDGDAIETLISHIRSLDDSTGIKLPLTLLKQIKDSELDLFLLSGFSEELADSLREMFFVVKNNCYIKNQFGVEYVVDYVGVTKAVISYDTLQGLLIFNIPSSVLKKGVFDLSICKTEQF